MGFHGSIMKNKNYLETNMFNNGDDKPLEYKILEDPISVQHVDWFIKTLRPLLISWFEHGYKHGKEDKDK
jgi:hypothetical protein